MNRKTYVWVSIMLVALMLTGLACNLPGQEPTATPVPPTDVPPTEVPPTQAPKATDAPKPTTPPEPTTPPVDPLLVSTLEDVKLATVQIVAEGSFIDPQVGVMQTAAGSGSGFIIDQEGIAVTNNHVVTGAALLQVYIAGESEPFNARVLGVSECSDLAVIDIEGDGYHYLPWYEEPARVGLDVYAAGFPLGDPEFTLTRGIVSKENADGESDWASVGSVIEHDATINPGNSGGPLVTADGQVVGVNYASSPSYNQYFAISYAEAKRVLDKLAGGSDVASIGVNGSAIDDGMGTTGIWVSSVETGSPAERAGVEPGDIITGIEGHGLAEDGTMATYCDILRSHHPDDVMSIQVLRYATEEVLEGQLNGDPLVLSFSFAQELGGGTGSSGGMGSYSEYVAVTDDTGAITMEIPADWSDVDGSVWEDAGEVIGAGIVASSDRAAFDAGYDEPGVIFLASATMAQGSTAAELLDTFDFSDDCSYDGRYDYADALYSGYYDVYSGCGGTDTILVVVVALPEDGAFATLLAVQAVSDADLDAVDHILNTFVVIGTLPDESGYTGGGATVDTSLTIYNDSDTSVWYVYIAPSTESSWGEDWLGGDVIIPGDSYTFWMAAGTYDILAQDPDGNTLAERYGEELTGEMEWTLYTDDTSGYTGGDTGMTYELALTNSSGIDVCYVFISPSTSDSWGDDWLGAENTIPNGTTFTFFVPASSTTYDLQAADCDGASLAEEYEVLFDQNLTWTLTP